MTATASHTFEEKGHLSKNDVMGGDQEQDGRHFHVLCF